MLINAPSIPVFAVRDFATPLSQRCRDDGATIASSPAPTACRLVELE
jgi:hypothetical protein